MFGRTLLIAGGWIDFDFSKDFLEKETFDTVIGVDAGLDAAKQLGIVPDHAIGDFDSASLPEVSQARERSEKGRIGAFLKYPVKKDATDLHLALLFAIENKAEKIVVLGATGRRMDHFLANVDILLVALKAGVPAFLVDRYNKIYLMEKQHVFRKEFLSGTYISFLPYTE